MDYISQYLGHWHWGTMIFGILSKMTFKVLTTIVVGIINEISKPKKTFESFILILHIGYCPHGWTENIHIVSACFMYVSGYIKTLYKKGNPEFTQALGVYNL